jgi:exodeoxyribonuclease V beta subunit
VQIVTVHTSKGLEYPVVMVPFPWDKSGGGSGERFPRGHDADDVRTLHLGGKGDAGYTAACAVRTPRPTPRSCACSTSP